MSRARLLLIPIRSSKHVKLTVAGAALLLSGRMSWSAALSSLFARASVAISPNSCSHSQHEGRQKSSRSNTVAAVNLHQLLPAEIWLHIFLSYISLQPGSSALDRLPTFENRCEETLKDRWTLCALSLTCRLFRPLAQEALFQHALPMLTRPNPALYGYSRSRQEKLYRSLLQSIDGHPLETLHITVRTIALDVSLLGTVNMAHLLRCLPNLRHLELYGKAAALDSSTFLNPTCDTTIWRYGLLSTALPVPEQVSHIKITLPSTGRNLLFQNAFLFSTDP